MSHDASPTLTGPRRIPTMLRLPESLKERVTQEADTRATTVTHLVEKALELYLNNLPSLEAQITLGKESA